MIPDDADLKGRSNAHHETGPDGDVVVTSDDTTTKIVNDNNDINDTDC